MTDEPCAICGRPAAGDHDPHHLTGRETPKKQLDDDVTAHLCHDDHELVHEDLRTEGLDRPLGPATPLGRVARRLERVAVFLARVAESVPLMGWMAALAGGVRRWADELHRCEAQLDAWNPGWRLALG
jgi:hypothetical protein